MSTHVATPARGTAAGADQAHEPGAMTVPAIVLGGTGYVAGELLRLLAGHPYLRLAGAVSESQAGEAIESAFPHLAGCFPGATFRGRADLAALLDGDQATKDAADPSGTSNPMSSRAQRGIWAGDPSLPFGVSPSVIPGGRSHGGAAGGKRTMLVLSAAPHGAAAPLIDSVLAAAEHAGTTMRVIDVSADFRFADPAAYAEVYGHPHGAPARLPAFCCALPEHFQGAPAAHVAHPGCFTTATLLAAVPLLALGLVEPRLSVVATTGSTGAGRTPTATTHHPARRSNLFAYSPLAHRHEPEMRALAAAASGVPADIHFIPQAGPFARGIYATLQARLLKPTSAGEIAAALADFYAGSPFVSVATEPPRLQDVVGSNRCRIGIAARGDHLAVFSAIDNLVKGAAGGAIQWANRLLGHPETAGLTQPGPGWI